LTAEQTANEWYPNELFACASIIHINYQEEMDVLRRMGKGVKPKGCAAILVVDGEGISEKSSILTVGARMLRRTVYLYLKERLVGAAEKAGWGFLRKGCLDPGLLEYGWRNYLFRRKGGGK
jgi:hypothetical protein